MLASARVVQEIPALFPPLALATCAAHWSMVRSRGHYPSDVFFGGSRGVAVALAVWRLWPAGRGAAEAGTGDPSDPMYSADAPAGERRR